MHFLLEKVIRRNRRFLIGEYSIILEILAYLARIIIVSSFIVKLNFASANLWFTKISISLKIRMIKRIFCWYTLFWIHFKHPFQQIKTLLINFTKILTLNGIYVVDFWKLHSDKLRIFEEVFLMSSYQWAKTLLNKVKLI
jgi:hypothetical protein